jgi:hypothetical protein
MGPGDGPGGQGPEGASPSDPSQDGDVPAAEGATADPGGVRRQQPLLGTPDFGTAVGAAMLGFEQALRSQPPPEVMAAEHRPIRGLSGQDGEIIVFPEEPPAEQEADR